ncbi:DUF4174 domain-containing protein [Dyadobacter sp. CY261]|uniref:DUF4174 domain-containing protein n=1 Tax=Dyadobacter sp. CY261 TaxID=2907203 RepID=UPI001F1CA97C|nr:DUF4174 domain-containing protein [Dyadobacter sp. CY261]MCF0072696.1 DUF4174 domain-containing protein [Dyadobacter sp. CY261]
MKTLFGIMLITLIAADPARQVLLFYTNSSLEKQKAQLAILDAYQKGVRARDIKVQSFSYSASNVAEWKKWNVDTTSLFTFILIGRDGGEKLRSSDIVSAEKLFGLIDAMPMRRNEIERNQSKKPE